MQVPTLVHGQTYLSPSHPHLLLESARSRMQAVLPVSLPSALLHPAHCGHEASDLSVTTKERPCHPLPVELSQACASASLFATCKYQLVTELCSVSLWVTSRQQTYPEGPGLCLGPCFLDGLSASASSASTMLSALLESVWSAAGRDFCKLSLSEAGNCSGCQLSELLIALFPCWTSAKRAARFEPGGRSLATVARI